MANRTVKVWLEANTARYIAGMKAAGAATKGLHDEIDKTNDRTAWLAQSILALTPAATTLAAGAVPVISGLGTQMIVAGSAAGVMALGFNGIGDSLKALNEYQLDPSAEKLEKLNEAMAKVGEDGQDFVRFLDALGPKFSELSNTARGGMFPGITTGIRDFMDLLPELDRIVDQVAKGVGQLGRDMGAGLSGEGFADFFDYLENDARPILVQFGRTMGNFVEGIANMVVAFGPLSGDFSKGFLEMSRAFVDWSDSLDESAGFQEFVDYVRTAGPMALDFLSSLTMALVEIVEAAAPIGTIMLPVLTEIFDVIAHLANTPLGPVVLGFVALTSAWGRLNAIAAITGSGVLGKATGAMKMQLSTAKMLTPSLGELGTAFYRMGQSVENQSKQTRIAMTQTKAFGRAAAPVAGQLALLAVATTGVADGMGLSNAATGAMIGSLAGGWGAAVGAAIGFSKDLAAQNDDLTESIYNTSRAIDEAFEGRPGTVNVDALAAQYKATFDAREKIRAEIEAGGFAALKSNVEGVFGENDYQEGYDGLKRLYDDLQVLREREAKASRERAADDAYFNSIQAETAALEDNIDAMRAKRAEALTGMNAELDYQEALLDASKAAKDYADVLGKNGQLTPGLKREGIAAKRELDSLAASWNGLSDEAQNSPGRFKKATDQFIETAMAMGYGRDEARKLAREILNIPTSHKTEIQVDADQAFQRLRAIRRSIESIDRNIVVGVSVVRGDTSGVAFLSGGVPRAGGGTVEGNRWPYGDKVLTPTAPGEEIISNRYGQADMNRAALKAGNAGAKLAVIGYADGGTIGATHRSVAAGRSYPAAPSYAAGGAGAGIDYDRLAGTLAGLRPLYGDVAISGDPTVFRQQMLHDEQAAGIGGF